MGSVTEWLNYISSFIFISSADLFITFSVSAGFGLACALLLLLIEGKAMVYKAILTASP